MRNILLDCKFVVIFLLLYDAYRKRQKYDLESNPVNKLEGLLNRSESPVDLLLLGDSVTERISKKDNDTRTLYTMVKDGLGSETRYYHICHSAYYMDIYHLYVKLLVALNIKPKMIIMPINLRNFSPQWDYNPMFQNKTHIDILLDLIKQKNISLNRGSYGKEMSIWKYVNSRVTFVGTRYGRMRNFLRIIASKPKSASGIAERRKNIFTFHYMNEVKADDRKIRHLIDIINLCKKSQIKLLVYFTPINYSAGVKYVGDAFFDNIKSNVRTIMTKANLEVGDTVNHKLIDLSTLLTSDYFFNPDETTEHLADIGRMALCSKLLELHGAGF